MRQVYFDAAGLSHPKHEPYIVVAGIILNPDKQWRELRQYLAGMADDYAPPEHRQGFAFHAMELFQGIKRFPRDRYPKEWRWRILDELASLPRQFDLPVVWGRVQRSDLQPGASLAPKADIPAVVHGQTIAFTVAGAAVEYWMNSVAEPDELAQMIMENDEQSRRMYKSVQRYLSDPHYNERFAKDFPEFRLSRVIYPMQFEEKTDSSALQVADICAFALKRWLMRTPESVRFYGPIRSNLVNRTRDEAWLPIVWEPPSGKPS